MSREHGAPDREAGPAGTSADAGGGDAAPVDAARMRRGLIRRKASKSDGGGDEPKTIAEQIQEIKALPAAEQAQRIGTLTPGQRLELATTLHQTGDKSLTQVAFDHTPDGEVDTLSELLAARFGLQRVGPDDLKGDGGKGIPWEAGGLRQAWQVLAALPAAHVEGNPKLWALVRYKVKKGAQAEGVYDDTDDKDKEVDQAAIGYDPSTLGEGDTDFSDEKDPLHGANAFNETMRHEVGHAVDAQLGASSSYCTGAAGGTWKAYGDGAFNQVVQDMVAASGGAISTWKDATEKGEIEQAIAKAMKDQKLDHVDKELGKLKFWKKVPAEQQQQVLADPALAAMQKNTTANAPWMADGGAALGDRIYEESYDGQWNSYATEARARKVSNYQFRAPGEWFAEAYAAYYEPVGEGQPQGAKLGSVDGKTKGYFDAVVDKMAPGKDGGKGDTAKKKAS